MTPCQRDPELFELPAVQADVDAGRVEWAQNLCIRACPRLAQCRAEGPGRVREAVWAGLIIARDGATLETMDEFAEWRAPDKRGRGVADYKPRKVLPPSPVCVQCGVPTPENRKRYCSDLCAGRSHEARRTRAAKEAEEATLPPCPRCGADVVKPQKLHCSRKCTTAAARVRARAVKRVTAYDHAAPVTANGVYRQSARELGQLSA